MTRSIKDSELRVYQSCQKYFREHAAESDKIKDPSRKRLSNVSLESRLGSSRHIEEEPLKTSSLLEESNEEERKEKPLPKGLPLLARKTRRCLDCNKLLTKAFKTFRN